VERVSSKTKKSYVTLFVGAEGCAETADKPWIRDSTSDEIEEFKKWFREVRAQGDPDADDWADFGLDHSGRPYWLMTVTSDAPDDVWLKADGHLRVLRF